MAKTTKNTRSNNSEELLEALTILEKEKNISKETLIKAIEDSLQTACKNQFDRNDNIRVVMNPETCEYHVYADKTVVEQVEDASIQISLADANMHDGTYAPGDIYAEEIYSREFGRIATQNAKNVILQKIREEERKVVYDYFNERARHIVTGVVQRYIGRNISINLGKADAILSGSEMIRGEVFKQNDHIRVYIVEVRDNTKGPKIVVSRTHPEFVRCLFEEEVAEVGSGIVEIRAIAREAGSRTKMAVASLDPDVDPVGACVGPAGARVNAVVRELKGEKIDIISWDDNAALLIENALSPAKVISVIADGDEKMAKVVVPDYQLSLAIGKEGQNARLAARLTGYKIDIKSETQARESGELLDYDEYDEYDDYDEYDEYDEEYDEEYADEYDEAYDEEYEEAYDEADGEAYDGEYEEDDAEAYEEEYDAESDVYREDGDADVSLDTQEVYADTGEDGDAAAPLDTDEAYADAGEDQDAAGYGQEDADLPVEDAAASGPEEEPGMDRA